MRDIKLKRKLEFPNLVDVDEFLKHLISIRSLKNDDLMNIKITRKQTLEYINIPEFLGKMFRDTKTPTQHFINTILRDFVIRMTEGETKYRAGILKRIYDIPVSIISEAKKNEIIVHLFGEPDSKYTTVGRPRINKQK